MFKLQLNTYCIFEIKIVHLINDINIITTHKMLPAVQDLPFYDMQGVTGAIYRYTQYSPLQNLPNRLGYSGTCL